MSSLSPRGNGETPDTVHGRLLESVHITGYTFERVTDELKWLLTDDRWMELSTGYEQVSDFVRDLGLDKLRVAVDQRKELAKLFDEAGASQRAIAEGVGVSRETVARDLGKREDSGTNVPPAEDNEPSSALVEDIREDSGTNVPPADEEWFQGEVDPAKLAKNRVDRKKRDREAERRRIEADRERAEAAPDEVTVDIRHGDFREALADLTGVDAIITDPPYPGEFLPLLDDLAAWADKALAEDGVLAVLFGQTHLPEVYRRLDGHRPYRWTACLLTEGPGYVSHPRKVQSSWKPVLVYGGGPRIGDVFRSQGQDAAAKTHHRWAQDYGAFSTLVERLTEPGQTVVDPFMGSGTTLLAAKVQGRHAIGCDVDADAVATARERLAT